MCYLVPDFIRLLVLKRPGLLFETAVVQTPRGHLALNRWPLNRSPRQEGSQGSQSPSFQRASGLKGTVLISTD